MGRGVGEKWVWGQVAMPVSGLVVGRGCLERWFGWWSGSSSVVIPALGCGGEVIWEACLGGVWRMRVGVCAAGGRGGDWGEVVWRGLLKGVAWRLHVVISA